MPYYSGSPVPGDLPHIFHKVSISRHNSATIRSKIGSKQGLPYYRKNLLRKMHGSIVTENVPGFI